MKYVVFVTKHHDSFTMWPTRQKRFPAVAGFPVHYSIADTPYQKDPTRMVQQAAKRHSMKLGWYYSTRDWTHPDYLRGDNRIHNDDDENQVMELLDEYGPVDLMWFDHTFGKWEPCTIPRLFERMHEKSPRLLVNDRVAKGLPDIPARYAPLNKADFDTPENRMGAFQYGRAWESCMILSSHAYVHVFEPTDEPLNLRALPKKVTAASTIDGRPVSFKQVVHRRGARYRESRQIREGGCPLERSPGVRFLRWESGRAGIGIDSGRYEFESRIANS